MKGFVKSPAPSLTKKGLESEESERPCCAHSSYLRGLTSTGTALRHHAVRNNLPVPWCILWLHITYGVASHVAKKSQPTCINQNLTDKVT